MPDDATGDKTEPPTPRRRSEARERGQIAKSQDLNAALILLGGMICLRWFAPRMMATLLRVMQRQLSISDPVEAARMDIVAVVSAIGMIALSAAGPILLGLVFMALIVNVAQVGLLLTLKPLEPKGDKLKPINGFKRLFSVRTVVQFGMNLMKLAVVCVAAYLAIRQRKGMILLGAGLEGWQQIILISKVLFEVGLVIACVLLVLALFDYVWQRYKHERDLKMSKQEVKEEMRRMEGDPVVRQRMRRMQFAKAIERLRSAVPKAHVVVTNPTEYAIAIEYNMESMQAPKVVAKGRNLLAQKIREIAIEHRIPIVERPPLAQALFKMVEVGQEIPEKFYQAVAEILAYVYDLSGRRPAGRPAAA